MLSTLEANSVNPDQAAKGVVLYRFMLFALYATKVHEQMREQIAKLLNRGKLVMCKHCLATPLHVCLDNFTLTPLNQQKKIPY